MRTYSIVLDPDPEDSGYNVTVPALPGCIAEGDSIEDCIVNAREAIEYHIEELVAEGREIPDEVAAPMVLQVTVDA
ncbi:MAG TPA: type II toxin-antitoxin system HicB family antitoxin [Candidatus Dormibacteraeota bacterium]|jgi:predicted RNase H-like HicB family nuclease|nr:type II toxin-antitoxin system HicB family antitoxin [Candidatus Dormibacteraeota bacterium]